MALSFPVVPLDDVKALLVDIDNTLYEYEPAHVAALGLCYRFYLTQNPSTTMEESAFSTLYRTHRDAVKERLAPQCSCRSRALAFLAMFEELGIRHPYAAAEAFNNLYWECFIETMTPLSAAKALLVQAKKRGIVVVAVSDMQMAVQVRKLQKLELLDYIDHLVTSEEAGAEKPDPAMFKRALAKAGVGANDAAMIGDDLDKDILGARAMGMRAYHVTVK